MNAHHPDDDTLIAYALDELDPSRRGDVESHAAACADCARMAGALRSALAGFRGAKPPDPPARVLVQLLTAQAEARERHRSGSWWRAPLAASAVVAATAVVFLGGVWFGQERSGSAAGLRPGVTMRARGETPSPPPIGFQSAPPMEAWLTSSGDSSANWLPPRGDIGDSL